ncbi:MAG: glycoside hydrolase family 1 protein [Candidatus Glassbacteria bacterium]|nr:glycoside hydrolase family 1 protein [Candidatus Glassbacteria bacterium]
MFTMKGFEKVTFPKEFLWGAAASAYQVEGNNTKNQWYRFEQEEGAIENGDRCGMSTNHYELFEQDFELAKELNHNTHRLGIEWSRLCPESPDRFDEDEIEHYRKVFEALKERNLTVFLTLHHFTEPLWFADAGSFTRPGAEHDFAKYVSRVAREFGGMVDFWIPFNEPQVALCGWLWGDFPPRKYSLEETCRECAGRLRGYAAAREVIRKHDPQAQVGQVMAVSAFYPSRINDFLDNHYAALFDYLWNECWIEGCTTGWIRFPLIGEDVFLPELRDSCDYWGVNFYTDQRVDSRDRLGMCKPLPSQKVTQMDWSWEPEGYWRAIERFHRLGKPLYLTENGIGTLDDRERVRFMFEHLRVVAHALDQGFDIRGYLHWSLLDNFEWACGYRPRFGLVHVDYETFERTVKPSGRFLAEVIEAGGMSRELVEKYLPAEFRY